MLSSYPRPLAVRERACLDPAETLLFAAACIKSGRVKFCPVERGGIAGHAAPQPSKTDDAERLAGKAQRCSG